MSDFEPRLNRRSASRPFTTLANVLPLRSEIILKSSAAVTERVVLRGLAQLNTNELKSINALLAYVAFNKNIDEGKVQEIVQIRFGVEDVAHLPQKDFDEVIRFLVDLCDETVKL